MMKMYREQRNFLLILIGLAGIGIIGVWLVLAWRKREHEFKMEYKEGYQ